MYKNYYAQCIKNEDNLVQAYKIPSKFLTNFINNAIINNSKRQQLPMIIPISFS